MPGSGTTPARLKSSQSWRRRTGHLRATTLRSTWPPCDRHKLLVERFAAVGDGAVIRPPFHCEYGFSIRLNAGVFLNFNCVILDVVEVTIGDRTQIGPGVQILADDHPRDLAGRASGLEFGRQVRIGRNVWIGVGAIILPAVSIGDDALIGAGSGSPVCADRGYRLRQSSTRPGLNSLITAKHSPRSETIGS